MWFSNFSLDYNRALTNPARRGELTIHCHFASALPLTLLLGNRNRQTLKVRLPARTHFNAGKPHLNEQQMLFPSNNEHVLLEQ